MSAEERCAPTAAPACRPPAVRATGGSEQLPSALGAAAGSGGGTRWASRLVRRRRGQSLWWTRMEPSLPLQDAFLNPLECHRAVPHSRGARACCHRLPARFPPPRYPATARLPARHYGAGSSGTVPRPRLHLPQPPRRNKRASVMATASRSANASMLRRLSRTRRCASANGSARRQVHRQTRPCRTPTADGPLPAPGGRAHRASAAAPAQATATTTLTPPGTRSCTRTAASMGPTPAASTDRGGGSPLFCTHARLTLAGFLSLSLKH
jgi:hypothetical protein